MIQQILDRLNMVDGATVREGFYSHAVARQRSFIFLQPFVSGATVPGAQAGYKEDLQLQVVAGIKLPDSDNPTADLINLVRSIRRAFYQGQRNAQRPDWLPKCYQFQETEPCKFIMPEAHEQHGLAVITLSISTSPTFDETL